MRDQTVCGVVVTYDPSVDDIHNFAKLRPQVEGLVVVDNGSSSKILALLRLAAHDSDFTLVEKGANLGIAAALNIGAKWAHSMGYAWVALFDQDSTVPPGFIDALLSAYDTSPRQHHIAMIVPRYIDSRLGTPLPASYAGDGSLQVAMTSGTLMPLSIFDAVGCFEELLFIDGVDYEYSLRLRSKGYLLEECSGAILQHAPANFTLSSIHGIRLFSTSNYSATRRYYRDRNKVWLMRKYFTRYPLFCIVSLCGSFRDGVKVMLVESNKCSKLYHMLLGVRDGLLGRMGKTVEL